MPPDIRDDRPDCPRELVDICVKMIQKKADNRFQSCSEVAAALEAWLASQHEPAAVEAAVEVPASKASAAMLAVGQTTGAHGIASTDVPAIRSLPTGDKTSPRAVTPNGKTSPFDPALADTATEKARGTVIVGRASAEDLDDVLEVQIIEDNIPATVYDSSGTINLGIEAERSVASRVRGRGSRSAKAAASAKKPPMPVWAWGVIAAGIAVVVIIIAVLATSGDSPEPPRQKTPTRDTSTSAWRNRVAAFVRAD